MLGQRDVDEKIMMELNDRDLLSLCKVDSRYRKICNDDNFWLRRSFQKYGREIIKPHNKTWKQNYLYLVDKIYIVYNGSYIIIPQDHDLIDYYINMAKNIYDDEYSDNFGIKSDEEVRRIVSETIAKAVAYYGQRILEDDEYNEAYYLEMNPNLFNKQGGKDSVLIPGQKGFGGWSYTNMERARIGRYFIDITNRKKVTLKNAKSLWNEDPDYIFVPSLRVSGNANDIRKYFKNIGISDNQIEEHILRAYKKGATNASFDKELRELEPVLALHNYQGLPQIPPIPPLGLLPVANYPGGNYQPPVLHYPPQPLVAPIPYPPGGNYHPPGGNYHPPVLQPLGLPPVANYPGGNYQPIPYPSPPGSPHM